MVREVRITVLETTFNKEMAKKYATTWWSEAGRPAMMQAERKKFMKTRKMEANGEIARHVNPMMMFEENWFLVTASDEGVTNTLTAAWGGFGNVCNKKVATVYIRPQRYTKKFIDKSGRFTLTFFNFNDSKIKSALGISGYSFGSR
jgi:hypothetical protein